MRLSVGRIPIWCGAALALLAGFLGPIVLFAELRYGSEREELREVFSREVALERLLSDVQVATDRREIFERELDRLEAEVAKLERVLPSRPVPGLLTERVGRLAEDSGVTLESLSAEATKEREFFWETTVVGQLAGDRKGLRELAIGIERLGPRLRLVGLDLDMQAGGHFRGTASISLNGYFVATSSAP